MTCPCKAELASILRDTGGPIGIVAWAKSVADRLDAPAPAEPQEPSPRYEVWLGTRGWIVGRYYGDDISWLDRESGRFLANTSKPRSEWASFPTESAARAALLAALLAASEPGVPASDEDKPPTEAEVEFAAGYMVGQREHPKPAPAPFDAAKWAEKMVRDCPAGSYYNAGPRSYFAIGGHDKGEGFAQAPILPLHPNDIPSLVTLCREHIAAALTAAHEAGKASPGSIKSPEGEWDSIADLLSDYAACQRALEAASLKLIKAGQPRPRRFSVELPKSGERIFAYDPRGWYFSGPFKNIPQDATHWHPEPVLPTPPAEKEQQR